MKKIRIITNNKKVKEKYPMLLADYFDKTLLEILYLVRDEIHLGAKLLSHPLSGSVKPNETPYKSIMISKDHFKKIDYKSVIIIEDSIKMAEKLLKEKSTRKWPEKILKDFCIIDLDLISSAIERVI